MATFPTPAAPFGVPTLPTSVTLDLPGTANVNDATKKAGMAFGKLIETTGLAIAESQRQLNEVGATTTTALAGQMVDVIAAQVNAYDADGNLDETGTKTIPMKLPLINFIDPVFYEWSQVRLQGMFFATEFVSSTETSSLSAAASASASNTGISMFMGAGSNKSSFGLSSGGSNVDTTDQQSYGHIRASALLNPKTDIGVPKPRQLIDAPSLAVQVGPDVDDASEAGARFKECAILCYKRDGSKQDADKLMPLSIEVAGAMWTFNPAAAADAGKTTAEGAVPLKLKRVFPVPAGQTEPDTTPVEVTVTARLGVVSTTTVLRM
ncbi:MAG: hypothetical protein KA375_11840 [Vitreoscilla sp.]|nr:hypothetical protein [Burkholderiales bacterium]MBP6338282.1 hypothetical protein [Vitreoscilla sp.]MBP6677311.1 hypothetical protein [Vitreoscilla sp.]